MQDSAFSPPASSAVSPQSVLRNCAICSGPSNGIYFGVVSCAACASFFRRSALEKRQYACRRANNCSIHVDGMRNSCRACRHRRCLESGMCMENVSSYQIGRTTTTSRHSFQELINSQNAISTAGLPKTPAANATPMAGTALSAFECVQLPSIQNFIAAHGYATASASPTDFALNTTAATPLTQQFAQSLKTFRTGHRALVHVVGDHPPQKFTNELRLITLEEYMQIHRGEISLILAFVHEYFPQIDQLPNETKVQILRYFTARLGIMNRAEMTIKSFPGQSTELVQLVMHPGCMIDRRRLDYFFANVKPKEQHTRSSQCLSIMEKIGQIFFGRYKPMDISAMEYAALVGLQLWHSIERHIPPSAEISSKRDQLYSELHSLVSQRIGGLIDSGSIGIRFGQLLALLHTIDTHCWEMEEVFTMIKIFLPSTPCSIDVWENLLENDTETAVDVERISVGGGADDERQEAAAKAAQL